MRIIISIHAFMSTSIIFIYILLATNLIVIFLIHVDPCDIEPS